MARIVLNTFGSFGDLHPYLALALELRRRGHEAVIATSEFYRAKVEREGVLFAPVRPDISEHAGDREFLQKLWDTRKASEFLIRDYLMPAVSDAYHDLASVCETPRADLLLTHAAGYAGPIVAETLKLRFLSVVLQPAVLFSAADPPQLADAPFLPALRRWGQLPIEAVYFLARLRTDTWARPLYALRRQLGLRRGANPFFEGMFSPSGTLILFSRHFAAPQADWPRHSTVCGFPFYDKLGEPQPELDGLRRFLAGGAPPILFTLGSSAVLHPGDFFRESLRAVRKLRLRAIFLVGPASEERLPDDPSLFVTPYAPYSEVMPHCAAVVHQGGIGTVAQTLRAGRPSIVVPWAHDQPDNALRVERLRAGRTIARERYSAGTLEAELVKLPALTPAAEALGEAIRAEDGVQTACDAVEAQLSR